jgi:hypothetical protein
VPYASDFLAGGAHDLLFQRCAEPAGIADAHARSREKAFTRRWFDKVWNQGRADLIEKLRAPGITAK